MTSQKNIIITVCPPSIPINSPRLYFQGHTKRQYANNLCQLRWSNRWHWSSRWWPEIFHFRVPNYIGSKKDSNIPTITSSKKNSGYINRGCCLNRSRYPVCVIIFWVMRYFSMSMYSSLWEYPILRRALRQRYLWPMFQYHYTWVIMTVFWVQLRITMTVLFYMTNLDYIFTSTVTAYTIFSLC